MYVTVDDVRDAGNLPDTITDEQIAASILRYQELVDRITRQFFEVRAGELLLDGSGSEILHLPFPIVELEELYLNENETAEPAENFKVYDRRGPLADDRRNPKIVLYHERNIFYRTTGRSNTWGIFERGRMNQKLVGQFGFVDPDDESFQSSIEPAEGNTSPDEARISGTPERRENILYEISITIGGIYGTFQAEIIRTSDNEIVLPTQTFVSGTSYAFDNGLSVRFIDAGGSTMALNDKWYIDATFDGAPKMIKRALTKLVLIKDYPDESGIEPGGTTGSIKREKTDGHEIEYGEVSVGNDEFMGIIGDREVAEILMAYKAPPIVKPSQWNWF